MKHDISLAVRRFIGENFLFRDADEAITQAGSLLDAGPPARTVTLLQNGHHPPCTGQVQGRGQSAEPGTDNDDGVRGAGHGAHPATVAAVVTGTRSSPPLR